MATCTLAIAYLLATGILGVSPALALEALHDLTAVGEEAAFK